MVQQVYLCLLLQGDSYSFKEAIVLAEYKVDVSSVVRDGARRTDRVCIVSLLHIFSIFSPFFKVHCVVSLLKNFSESSPSFKISVCCFPLIEFSELSPSF